MRQKGTQFGDLPLLLADHGFGQSAHRQIPTVRKLNARHCDRTPMMGDHGGREIEVRIARESDGHVAVHLLVRS